MASIEEIQARREARKAEAAKPRGTQHAIDLEALDALEVEHGDNRVAFIELGHFEDGLTTLVVVRMPKPVEYKRFQDMNAKKHEGAGLEAARLLCASCVAYPEKDVYAKIVERVPGVVDALAILALKLSEGKALERGKV